MPKEEQEFELIPLSPLRRLEKRIEKIESTNPAIDIRDFLKEIVDIVKMNQGLVDELVKANDSLRIELSRLPGKLEELISKLDDILSLLKAAATEETTAAPETFKPLLEKIEQLIEANKKIVDSNEAMLSTISEIEKKLRLAALPPRPVPPIVKRPIPPLKQ